MTPANEVSAPAAVFPGTTAQRHDNARQIFNDLAREMLDTNAFLEGALALVDRSVHTKGDETLCNAQTMLEHCMERQQSTYEKLDMAEMGERDDRDEALLAAGATAFTPLQEFGHITCQNVSAVAALIAAARNLITGADADQHNKQVFMACEVLEQAEVLAQKIAGDSIDATAIKRAGI